MIAERNRSLVFLLLSIFFCGAGFKGFIEVADDYYENDLNGLDNRAFDLVLDMRTSGLTIFFKVITHLGDNITYFLMIAAGMIFFWKKNLFSSLIRLGVVIILTALLSYVLKELIERPRPEHDHFVVVKTLSFPSGHAMIATAFYVFIALLSWRSNSRYYLAIAVFSCVMILLIGFSRIYLGVHYLSDVLAGYAAGLFICGLALLIYEVADRIISARKQDL